MDAKKEKSFQIEFRDDDEYISKIEVSKIPTGKVSVSSASSSLENTKTLNLGDIIDVTSEAESLTYRLDEVDDDVVNFVPSIIEEKKEYVSDFFSYYVYDKYDEKSGKRNQSGVRSTVARSTDASFFLLFGQGNERKCAPRVYHRRFTIGLSR